MNNEYHPIELSRMFVKMTEQTSYRNKTFEQAKKNIFKWRKKILTVEMEKENFEVFKYILDSRLQNILILQGKPLNNSPKPVTPEGLRKRKPTA